MSLSKEINPKKSDTYPEADRNVDGRHIPWMLYLFLAVMFLLSSHDLDQAKRGVGNYNLSADDLIARSVEGPSLRRVALALLGAGAILSLFYHHVSSRLQVKNLLGWSLIAFAGWAFLSASWAVDPFLTMKRLTPFAIIGISGLATARRFSNRDILRWTFLCTCGFLLIGIIAEMSFGSFQPFSAGYRFSGSLDPNSQGVNCGLLLLSAVAVAATEKRWRLPAIISALLGALFLFLSASRTGLAAALLALVTYIFSIATRRSRLLMVCGFGVLGSTSLLLSGTGFTSRLGNAAIQERDQPNSLSSFNGRTMIWKDVANYIPQNPVLGCGYGGFWTPAHINEVSDKEKQSGGISSAHSAYIEYLLTLGGIGLVLYVLLLIFGMWQAFSYYLFFQDRTYAFLGSFLVFCVLDGVFDSDITLPGTFLTFLWIVVLTKLGYVRSACMSF